MLRAIVSALVCLSFFPHRPILSVVRGGLSPPVVIIARLLLPPLIFQTTRDDVVCLCLA